MNDQVIRQSTSSMEVPEFESPAFTTAPPLEQAVVAIVTTAGLQYVRATPAGGWAIRAFAYSTGRSAT